ncbi:hypothetical protein EMCRGX_G010665 [Ephydatia muelleri]
MHPRSKTLHMIDFVITRQKDRYLMQDTRVYHSVDVWSDHFFVGSSMVMPVSKPHHRVRLNSSINRRFDVSRLSQPEVVMQYQQALTDALHQLPSRATSNETSETLWSSFSKAVINAATNHLGFTSKRPTPDWFYDNLDTIQPMLLLPADLLTQYRSARNHVKYHVHKIQNGWWKHKAEELNHFHIKGDWKNLFSSWKLLSFHRQVHIRSVLDKSGSNVISDPTQIRDRWRSHFNHVLNTTASSYDDSVFNIIPQQPIMEELARPPTVEEVRCALSQVKCNRAAGKDGIPAELLIYGGEQALTFLHTICTEVWSSELIPKEWVDSIIVPLPKKGNLQLCDNWRGISLLSVEGKVFARVLANRITPVAESILDETQCGFQKCRGTIDMIFVARQLQEKAREQMCQLYMCFFDLKKADDSVPRHALWLLLARLGFPSKLDGKLFRRSGTKLPMSVRICDLRFADDVMTGCLDSAALQRFIDRFTHVARSWGLSVSTDKTKVITQSATSSSPFNIRGTTIETVTAFQYLGSVLSSDVSLDNEINSRLSKAAKLFSALKVHRLALPEVLKGFQDSITKALSSLQSNQPDINSSLGSDVESIWSCFVQAITSAADTYIGPQTHCPLPDWFRDDISVIQPLLQDKKNLFHDILHFRKDNLPVPPALLNQGLYFMGMVKTATKEYPKMQLLQWASGNGTGPTPNRAYRYESDKDFLASDLLAHQLIHNIYVPSSATLRRRSDDSASVSVAHVEDQVQHKLQSFLCTRKI